MKKCINSNWDVRELQRQKTTLLYERIANSKDKNKVIELSSIGYKLNEPKDIIKDPFVLEFLDIKETTNYLESDLEKKYFKSFKRISIRIRKRIYICWKSSKNNIRFRTFLSGFSIL